MKAHGHNLKRSYSWLVWLEPALVLLLAPVLLFPSPLRSILFLFLPLIFVLHFLARRRIVEPSPVNAPLALLMFMVLVSLFATYDISFSLPKMAGVLLGAAVFFVILNVTTSSKLLAQMLGLSILGMIALAILGLLGTQWTSKVPVLERITAHLPLLIKGVPGAEEGFRPNAVGGTLILFLPLQIAVLPVAFRDLRKNSKLAIWILISVFMTAGVLLLTQSRGAWIGMAAGLLLLVAWMGRWGKWLSLAVVSAGLVLVLRVGSERLGNAVMSGIGGTATVGSTMDARAELWSRAIYGISDFPFTGMGMNTFRKVVNVLYPLFLIPPDVDIASCHNQLLQTALDLGIPGLVAYVALLAVAITMGIQIWRRSKEYWIRSSAQGLVCGIVAQQVFGITDAIPLGAKVGIFFWVALGILAAMYRLTDPPDPPDLREA
jgi:putative inorganic carbon (HCO3(-)) transporter